MMNCLRLTILLLACAGLGLHAQPGTLDPSFNPIDKGTKDAWANGGIMAIAVQPDGKQLLGGAFTKYAGMSRHHIARLNADGSLDTSFDPIVGPNGPVYTVLLQPDGKILIGGDFTTYGGVSRPRIARLNPDGSLDAFFDPGAGANGYIKSMALQPDGRILVGGAFTNFNNSTFNRLARLHANGSLDQTLNISLGMNGTVNAVSLQTDGKILIAGIFTKCHTEHRPHIARLNEDGSVDATFNPGWGANERINALALQNDGKIIIGGYFSAYHFTDRNIVARLNADGSLDHTFEPNWNGYGEAQAVAVQPDGKILAAGSFDGLGMPQFPSGIFRLNSDGSWDSSLSFSEVRPMSINAIASQANGLIVAGGQFKTDNFKLFEGALQMELNGSPAHPFNFGTGANGWVVALAVQPDGKILVGGGFSRFNGTPVKSIVRLQPDGNVDTTWGVGTGPSAPVMAIALRPDGKIIVAGYFNTFDGIPRKRIAQLLPDGGLDMSFDPGEAVPDVVETLLLQPDGKILVGGWLTYFDGTPRHQIVRLNEDGSLDLTFGPNMSLGGQSPRVLAIGMQADGKMLIGGHFTSIDGTTVSHLARLHPDGSFDPTFHFSAEWSFEIWGIVVLPDGKTLIGGEFYADILSGYRNVARLNPDGSFDTTFKEGGADGTVFSLAVQPDGKTIAVGCFDRYAGTPSNHIARLNADGSLDTTFKVGSGIGGSKYPCVAALALQPDGKVLIGGDFATYDDMGKTNLARIIGGASSSLLESAASETLHVFPNPSHNKIWLDMPSYNGEAVSVSVYNSGGQLVLERRMENIGNEKRLVLNLEGVVSGVYAICARTANRVAVGRAVVIR